MVKPFSLKCRKNQTLFQYLRMLIAAFLIIFTQRSIGALQQGWIPNPNGTPSGVWTGNLPMPFWMKCLNPLDHLSCLFSCGLRQCLIFSTYHGEFYIYWIQFLNIKDKGSTTSPSYIFSNLIEISSWPWALFTKKTLLFSEYLHL